MDGGNPLRLEVLGSSGAAAVVVSALYFLGAALTIANWFYTKFTFYDVLLISCVLRVVGFAARAAYLIGSYHPSLEGIYLAFSNAGFGASLANIFLVTAVWMKKPHPQLAQTEQAFYQKFMFIWVLPVIAFGPITGVVASGILYGIPTNHGLVIGNRLKKAATWGLFCVITVYWFLIIRITLATLLHGGQRRITPARKTQKKGSSHEAYEQQIARQERWVWVLWVCASLLLMRGICGVLSDYQGTEYIYINDKDYYPLFEIPELAVLLIFIQPTLMARLALAYPKPPPDDDEQEQVSSKEDTQETNGHADPADVESGANNSNGAQ